MPDKNTWKSLIAMTLGILIALSIGWVAERVTSQIETKKSNFAKRCMQAHSAVECQARWDLGVRE